jgi:hypothetical protein
VSRRRSALAAFAACLVTSLASAQDVKVHAYADARLVDAPDDPSFVNGGPGRTRYGSGDTQPRFGGAALVITSQFTPALFALADVQLQQTDHASPQLTEAYLRYRPVSLSAWRASLKGGLYFIPISLENDGIGWTSPWTITPSAINSWVGEELRGLGAEAREEWRGDSGTLGFGGGLFRHNDAAGNILVMRGWSLSDLVYGVGGRLREPSEDGGREQYAPFQSIGGRTGWYADTVRMAYAFLVGRGEFPDGSGHLDRTGHGWRNRSAPAPADPAYPFPVGVFAGRLESWRMASHAACRALPHVAVRRTRACHHRCAELATE